MTQDMSKDLSLADKAIEHLLVRIRHDPRLAYHFDPLTQSMGMLTEAHAEALGLDVEQFRKDYYALLSYEAPATNGTHQASGD
jgi:hypothetical protein